VTAGTAKTTRQPKEKRPPAQGGPTERLDTMTAKENLPDNHAEADRRYYREVAILLTCLGVIAVVSVVIAWT
jgi:hypothetical protein